MDPDFVDRAIDWIQFDSVRFGTVQFASIWFHVRFDSNGFVSIRVDDSTTRFDPIRFDSIKFKSIRFVSIPLD